MMVNYIIFLFFTLTFKFVLLNDIINKKTDCKCTIEYTSRVINGYNLSNIKIPWQVSLGYYFKNIKNLTPQKKINSHFCGGVILNRKWILTAAHCVFNKSENFGVGYDSSNLLVNIFNKGRKKIKNIYFNYFYKYKNYKSYKYDIALVELNETINFNHGVRPACLPSLKTYVKYKNLIATGWGSTKNIVTSKLIKRTRNMKSNILQGIDLYDDSKNILICHNKEYICTKSEKPIKSMCKGDSGSPLHSIENYKFVVVGILSSNHVYKINKQFSQFCGFKNYGAFIRVSQYLDFIQGLVGDDYCLV